MLVANERSDYCEFKKHRAYGAVFFVMDRRIIEEISQDAIFEPPQRQ